MFLGRERKSNETDVKLEAVETKCKQANTWYVWLMGRKCKISGKLKCRTGNSILEIFRNMWLQYKKKRNVKKTSRNQKCHTNKYHNKNFLK